MTELEDKITEYLSAGGMFNPELMEHEKVRDLLIECREEIKQLRKALELASKPLPSVNWKDGKPYSYCPECGRIEKDNK